MPPRTSPNAIGPEDLTEMASLKNWGEPPQEPPFANTKTDAIVDCGWGRLIFGQTFREPAKLAEVIQSEREGRRDVALYVREPHVVLSQAPQALFLDPSYTFRLNLAQQLAPIPAVENVRIRLGRSTDEKAINSIYAARGMVPVSDGYMSAASMPACVTVLVAQDTVTRQLIGVVMGIDHHYAFRDTDNGSSLWSLAVDPQVKQPGVGRRLIKELADRFRQYGRSFMDLSVIHDNEEAKTLYSSLGFQQVPVYCIKKKNPVNEKLYIGPEPTEDLNVYAQIIVTEARRRGIGVEIEDAQSGLFTLIHGGRKIACRESLSDLTSAVAMSRCDDKTLTHRLLHRAGLNVPTQMVVNEESDVISFHKRYPRVVVKPARGEQGRGIAVDLTDLDAIHTAVGVARDFCETVIIEEFVTGEDLRVIVIDGEVIAAAVRKPASVIGDGRHSITELIDKQSRRRAAATQGESTIPFDAETIRCIRSSGHDPEDVLETGAILAVRKTANLHTGGTIHDVTDQLSPTLREACEQAAHTLEIPLVGLDLLVPDVKGNRYVIIEANERPGLANHEPAPTAERFVDLLFPHTRAESKSA